MIQKPATDTGLIERPVALETTLPLGMDVPAPAPRKRGRPRKNPLPEDQAAAAAAPTTAHAGGSVATGSDASSASGSPTRTPRSPRAAGKAARGGKGSVAASATDSPGGTDSSTGGPANSSSSDSPANSSGSNGSNSTGGSSNGTDSPGPSKKNSRFGSSNNAKSASNYAGGSNSGGGSNYGGGSGGSGGSNSGSNGSSNSYGGSRDFSGKNKNGYQNYGRRPRRNFNNNQPREQIVPQASREELEGLKVAELREKAVELELDLTVLKKKHDLIDAVLEAQIKAEGFIACEGILDLLPEGYGFLRTSGYLPGESDVYVGMSAVRRNGLRKGDLVTGQVRPARENEKYAALHRLDTINGQLPDEARNRRRFADLTPVYPDERLLMEHGINTITARTIDLVAPIGKGQRGLIVSPPKAGKTTILKDIASAISANNPSVHLMCLLVDERPEEVTDMERSIKGEVISSTFDMPSENHIAVAELVAERAKRLVEIGRDVVILLDSITRLARAYNLAQPASGRILSGGVDSTALYPPKRFLGAARNIEDGGSLTILASALIETGSKMDEVIFEEFKGTGNMELRLDRDLADRRIFPAIDPVASGTRKEELLLDSQEAPLIWAVRRILANMNNTERAMEMLIKSLKQTQNNAEFLMRTAKKAQQRSTVEIAEL
jgi:transcription termination factor Rho